MAERIYFSGEGMADNLRSVKLATVRRPDPEDPEKYRFERNQRIDGICSTDRETVPLVVLESRPMMFSRIPQGILGLDGFISENGVDAVGVGVSELRNIGGRYEGLRRNYKMVYVVHAAVEVLNELPTGMVYTLTDNAVVDNLRNPECRPLFFPSLAYWCAYRGKTCLGYLEWLHMEAELIDTDEWDKFDALAREKKYKSWSDNRTGWWNVVTRRPGTERLFDTFVTLKAKDSF